MRTSCLGVFFHYVGTKTLLLTPVIYFNSMKRCLSIQFQKKALLQEYAMIVSVCHSSMAWSTFLQCSQITCSLEEVRR